MLVRLCDSPEVVWLDLPMEMSFHEFSGGAHPLDDMDVILTASAGQGFIAKLAQRGVQVITCGESDPRKAVRDFLTGAVKAANPHAHLELERHDVRIGKLLLMEVDFAVRDFVNLFRIDFSLVLF